jgi:hypothetical protein
MSVEVVEELVTGVNHTNMHDETALHADYERKK